MKNVSRNKFLLCFRPAVDMDLMLEPKAVVVDRSQKSQGLTYVGVKNEDMKPSRTKSSVSDTKNSIMIHRPGKNTFSQVIKAAIFEIILARRVRDRIGIDQESYSSKHNLNLPLSSRDKLLDKSSDKSVYKVLAGKGNQDTISKSNSSSSSSSSSPNTTQKAKRQQLQNNCNTYSHYQEGENNPKQGVDRTRSNGAIYLLLISLAVTIFWGKFCAILFTSIWLYFHPYQQPTGVIGNLENIKRSPEKKSRLQEEIHNRRAARKEPQQRGIKFLT